MAFIEWNDDYRITFAELDEQHRQLFDLINKMYEAMMAGRSERTMTTVVHEMATMADVLEELMDYTSYHFLTEENYMVEYAYPEYDVQRTAHGQFIERVEAFQRDFDNGRAVHSMEIVEFIRDWWLSHILVLDKTLGVFLTEKGLT